MARLRIRVELNRGGVGVPLQKLASVVQETQRFLQMVGEDVHVTQERGEWLAFDFDHESLNFTAEYVGPVTADQVQAFAAAFDGTTSLRRATIAQFTRIAEAIGEDELIGFGLYGSDQEVEPSEWRCLSRRTALRIAEEIQLLGAAAGIGQGESHLPSIIDAGVGARLFRERRDRHGLESEPSRWPRFVREVEANLGRRIDRLEGEVQGHSREIHDLRETTAATEESFRSLLTSVENFCGQATRQLEKISPPPQLAEAGAPPPHPPESSHRVRNYAVAAVLVLGIATASYVWRSSKPAQSGGLPAAPSTQARSPESAAPFTGNAPVLQKTAPPKESVASGARSTEPDRTNRPAVPKTAPEAADSTSAMHVDVQAREPSWVSVTNGDGKKMFVGLLEPNETRNFEVADGATLRTGNAGGLTVLFNGQDVGTLGPSGKIRELRFADDKFEIVSPQNP